MPSNLKTEMSISDFEVETEDLHHQAKARLFRVIDSLRVSMTALALIAGIVILGLSADSLAVYHRTHVAADFFLPLWPEQFNIRPTTALVVGSTFITLANVVSLVTSKTSVLRRRVGTHTSVSIAAPIIGLLVSIIAMAYFYAVNTSTTVDTFQSWTCRWNNVPMKTQPHFGTLCKESQASLALAIFLVPLEFIVVMVAGYQTILERQLRNAPRGNDDKSTRQFAT